MLQALISRLSWPGWLSFVPASSAAAPGEDMDAVVRFE